MSFNAGTLTARLSAIETLLPAPRRYVIAISGGLDSSVLLHAAAASRERLAHPLLAVHVDHRLNPESPAWAARCAAECRSLGVDFVLETVEVTPSSGTGPEAAARSARYAALSKHVGPGDWLLSAHHQDDQAETVLLNLLRGSGPLGLAGMPEARRFGAGWLVRPLLDVPRRSLEVYAAGHGLDWIEDPMNAEARLDRNFLRHEVLPLLERRWQGSRARLAVSASLAGEAATLLAELGRQDLEALGAGGEPETVRPDRIPIAALSGLPPVRQRNLLRHAFAALDLPPPNATQLARIFDELIPARADAAPRVHWHGAEVRRYRGVLYLLEPFAPEPPPPSDVDASGEAVIGARLGVLTFVPAAPVGLSPAVTAEGLRLSFRAGGESIRPHGDAHTRRLKKYLQERGVVPWMRERIPLLWAGDRLVAVGDLCIAADAASEPGTAVRWVGHPPIF